MVWIMTCCFIVQSCIFFRQFFKIFVQLHTKPKTPVLEIVRYFIYNVYIFMHTT